MESPIALGIAASELSVSHIVVTTPCYQLDQIILQETFMKVNVYYPTFLHITH